MLKAAQRLAFSRAATVDRYECKHKISFQNATDLGAAQRRRLECVVGPRLRSNKALQLRLLSAIEGHNIINAIHPLVFSEPFV